MPTSFTSNASERIFSASAPSTTSASGGDMCVKIGLQQNLRGDLIAYRFAVPGPNRCVAQRERRIPRGEAFVAELDRQREAPPELLREAVRSRRHRVRRTVGMGRKTNEQEHGSPFGDQ